MKDKILLPILASALLATMPLEAHNGLELFLPGVPSPGDMTIDGNNDDWGWLDDSFYVTSDQQYDTQERNPTRDDYDTLYGFAWSAPPENMLYFFFRAQDDTLRLLEEDPKRWWADDALQLNIDADHSGGGFLGENIEEINNAQRYHLRIQPPPGEPVLWNGHLEYIDQPEIGWSSELYDSAPTGWSEVGWTVNPPDAENFSTNVTWTIELRTALWDIFDLSAETSTRHNFEAGQIIHLTVVSFDGDTESYNHEFALNETSPLSAVDANLMVDYFLLEAEDAPTAAEENSWGWIKSHLDAQLR